MNTGNNKGHDARIFVIILGICLSIGFAIAGVNLELPGYAMGFYDVRTYVGGDAYNFIIEAIFRAGKIAGIMASKTMCFAMAGIFLFFTAVYAEKSYRKEPILTDKPKEEEKPSEIASDAEADTSADIPKTESITESIIDNSVAEDIAKDGSENTNSDVGETQ